MYQPKNILITGAAGFIGAAFTVYLGLKYPHLNIIGLDKLSYCSNLKNLAALVDKTNFKFIQGDITEIYHMQAIFKEHQIDTVIHFAAYSHVDHSFGNSIVFTRNNVIGTHVLLEAANHNKIKRFIHVSTDEVYGDNDTISTEETVLNPTNPYSASKAAAEALVKSYYHSFKLPIIITRGNNVYGPCQYPEKAIPRFCLRLLKNLKCQIQGSGAQTRSFLYIDDVCLAFEKILFDGQIGQIYNIGAEQEYSINYVIKALCDILNYDYDQYIEHIEDRNFNDQRYHISNSKLINLGWEQKIDFKTGLSKTLRWYQDNQQYWSDDDLAAALKCNNRIVN